MRLVAEARSTLVRHYTDSGDNPTWATDKRAGTTTTTRYNELINADLGLTLNTTGSTTTAELALNTRRGDTATTITLSPSMTGPGATAATGTDTWTSYTGYGQPRQTTTNTPGGTTGIGYGWLGTKQRGTQHISLTLMGARLPNRTTGLFTSTDPVNGGNTTAYGYPNDPINSSDTDGNERRWRKFWRYGAEATGAVAFGACVVATLGACGEAAAIAVGASAGWNYYRYRHREISGRRAIRHIAMDVELFRFHAVRCARHFSRRAYQARRAARWGRHAYRRSYGWHSQPWRRVSCRRAAWWHPYWPAVRWGAHGYGGWGSYNNFRNT